MTIYKWTDCFMASRCDMKFDCATCNIYKAHCRCKAEVADYKPPSREYRRGNEKIKLTSGGKAMRDKREEIKGIIRLWGWQQAMSLDDAADKIIKLFDADYWKRLALAAMAYINENPCDPDIYPEQWKAWNEYQKLLQERDSHG